MSAHEPPHDDPDRPATLWRGRSGSLYALGLLALTLFSAWTKAVNQFGFFVYPDSYYYLLVAKNLLVNHHPTGTLGAGGMAFPPPGYAAMKATFPMLAAAVMALGSSAEAAGHLVSSAAAVLAVPAAFWATWRLFGSRPAALAAAALTAASYSVTYWSGFVLSDSLSLLLAFTVIAVLAKRRPDALSNPGDIAVGVVTALLLLSRPTYAVALPLLAWAGFRAFGWTWRRLATAAVACLLPVAAISVVWFPPPALSGAVLLRLLPELAAAAAGVAVAVFLLRRREGRIGSAGRATYHLLSLLPLAAFLLQRSFLMAGRPSPFWALEQFAARDGIVLLLTVAGALALELTGRRETAGALLAGSALLLAVYWWVEPAESRYLVHLLPFLVPVSAAAVGLPRALADRGGGAWRIARGAAVAVLLIAAVGAVAQGWRGARHAQASFLATDYPSEVTARVRPALPARSVLVTALPWAYHFRLGATAWAAAPEALAQAANAAGSRNIVLLVDASLRYHYPELAAAAERRFSDRQLLAFTLPTAYLYGYSGLLDTKPVRLLGLTADDLRSLEPTPAAR